MSSVEHLQFFIEKLGKKEPFAIIRPADGEYLVMVDTHFTNCDDWTFNGGSLKDELISIGSITNTLNNFFVGIPCKACQGEKMVNYFKTTLNLTDKNTTYANIFCNKNWLPFTSFLISTKLPLYYIGPGQEKTDKLNVLDRFTIDPYLVNNWDSRKDMFRQELTNWIESNSSTTPSIFIFSAGPISKIIIPYLYSIYPLNQYLDVGSSLDIFLKGQSNRGYIHQDDTYTNVVCDFEKGHI